MTDTVIFDVDGTLVDSNYQHALAWYDALREFDITVPVWHIHRAIGMGGDKLVEHVAGKQAEEEHGDELRDMWQKKFERVIDDIAPFGDSKQVLQQLKDAGFTLVLASSGEKKQVETFLELFDGKELADEYTTSADAEESKPAPDLLQIAMKKVDAGSAVMVGDSVWDCEAAQRAGAPMIAVLTGGFSREELQEAGAQIVVENLTELAELIGRDPLQPPK